MSVKTAAIPAGLLAALAALGVGLFLAIGPGPSPEPGDPGSRQTASGVPDNGASAIGVQDQREEPASTTPVEETQEKKADASPSPALPTAGSRELVLDASQFRQLIPRDAIFPIYEPLFAPAEFASLPPDELVIGVEINGESKAYPIGLLIFREMVNDTVGGVPVLVTW